MTKPQGQPDGVDLYPQFYLPTTINLAMKNSSHGMFFLLVVAVLIGDFGCSAKKECTDHKAPNSEQSKATTKKMRVPSIFASPFEAAAGRYEMNLSSDAGWHHNLLEIDRVDRKTILGSVSIDLSIGPEGRAPTPDEKVHKVAFHAVVDPDPNRLHFSLIVGKVSPFRYTFDLYLCPQAGTERCGKQQRPCLTGEVVVESEFKEKVVLSIETSKLN